MDKRFELVTRNTEEIVTDAELRKVLEKKTPVAYWGTTPTGQIHTGYLIPVQKMQDFVEAGFKFKILIADIHAYLDDMKTPWELLEVRSKYYKLCLQSLGLKHGVEYVFDHEFKYDKNYIENIYKLSAMVTQKKALHAASEVCRLKNPKVSELFYPLAQSLDCWKLGVDVAYAGLDQRHIYMLTREVLPRLGFKPPTIVMTPMLSGLIEGGKASASIPQSNIRVYEDPESIKQKIAGAWCPPHAEGNPILEHYKFIFFVRLKKILIERDKKFGGDIAFANYNELETAYLNKKIHANDLKADLAARLAKLLMPCRKFWEKHSDIIEAAYPKEFL